MTSNFLLSYLDQHKISLKFYQIFFFCGRYKLVFFFFFLPLKMSFLFPWLETYTRQLVSRAVGQGQ